MGEKLDWSRKILTHFLTPLLSPIVFDFLPKTCGLAITKKQVTHKSNQTHKTQKKPKATRQVFLNEEPIFALFWLWIGDHHRTWRDAAARQGDLQEVEILLTKGAADARSCDHRGHTPL